MKQKNPAGFRLNEDIQQAFTRLVGQIRTQRKDIKIAHIAGAACLALMEMDPDTRMAWIVRAMAYPSISADAWNKSLETVYPPEELAAANRKAIYDLFKQFLALARPSPLPAQLRESAKQDAKVALGAPGQLPGEHRGTRKGKKAK